MRLVCPNCSAQYEVDGSMIPDDGRDVQCSNCGHTWFELPGPRETDASGEFFASEDEQDTDGESTDAESEATEQSFHDDDGYEEIEEPDVTTRRGTRPENLSREVFEDDEDFGTADDDDEDAGDASAVDAEEDDDADDPSEAIRAITSAAASVDETDDDDGGKDENDVPAAAAEPRKRRPADTAALDILREEAERELSQRRARPSENLETQPDLGLEDIRNRKSPSRALRARMAHLGEEMPEDAEEASEDTPEASEAKEPDEVSSNKTRYVKPPSEADDGYEEPRRDLLPDIEEINSTLRTAALGPEATEAKRRSGFRVGFLMMLFLTVAAIFAYSQAPAIARALPESEPTLTAFLDWTNGIRDQIDGLIGN